MTDEQFNNHMSVMKKIVIRLEWLLIFVALTFFGGVTLAIANFHPVP